LWPYIAHLGSILALDMTQNAKFVRKIAEPETPEMGPPIHRQRQTGWPAIGILAFLLAGVFAGGCVISGESVQQFYREWVILTWIGAAFIALCILGELSCLKCPQCRSRAIAVVSVEEVDRWIGLKAVSEDTVGVGGFQTFGESRFRGLTGGVAVTRKTIPVTKRCVLTEYRCDTCGCQFERKVVEEML
jgi:hypothetical protein